LGCVSRVPATLVTARRSRRVGHGASGASPALSGRNLTRAAAIAAATRRRSLRLGRRAARRRRAGPPRRAPGRGVDGGGVRRRVGAVAGRRRLEVGVNVLLHLRRLLVSLDGGAAAGVGDHSHAAHERNAVAGPERPAGGARRDALAVDEGAVEAAVDEQRAARGGGGGGGRLPAEGAVAAAYAQVVGGQVEVARLASEDVGFVCGG
jgi:hypothetical protein